MAFSSDQFFKILSLLFPGQSPFFQSMPSLYDIWPWIAFWLTWFWVWRLLWKASRSGAAHWAKDGNSPQVSVLIAIKNEVDHLPALLASLDALTYPRNRMEVRFADDGSTDGGSHLLEDFCADCPWAHHHFFEVGLGKALALEAVAAQAQGDLFLFTDGDCMVPPDWIQRHLAHYRQDDIGMVGGWVGIAEPARLWRGLQHVDWIRYSATGALWADRDKPLSVFGNHLSLRRQAYLDAGGMAEACQSVTEDNALMRQLLKRTDCRVAFETAPGFIVRTQAEPTLKAFFEQRRRWAVGARGRGFYSTALMALAWLPIPVIVAMAWVTSPIIAFVTAGIYFGAEGMLNRRLLRHAGPDKAGWAAWLHPLFFWLYVTAMIPAYLTQPRVTWKNKELRHRP